MVICRNAPRHHLFCSILLNHLRKNHRTILQTITKDRHTSSKFQHTTTSSSSSSSSLLSHSTSSSVSSLKSIRNFHQECQRFSSSTANDITTTSHASSDNDEILPTDILENGTNTTTTIVSADVDVDDDEWLISFLDLFAQTIEQDVNNTISKVEENPGFLVKRWDYIYEREKKRCRQRRRILIRPNNNNNNNINLKYTKPSVEDQWNDIFHRYDYRDILRSYSSDPSFNGLGVANNDEDEDENTTNNHTKEDESSHHEDIHLSPIFRYPVTTEHLSLEDFQNLTLNERKNNDNDNDNYMPCIENNEFQFEIEQEKKKGGVGSDMYQNAILRSMSLLIAMKPEDWRRFDSGSIPLNKEIEIHTEQEFVAIDGTGNSNEIQQSSNITNVREFLQNVAQRKYNLTSSVINLLLAHLVTSTEIDNRMIGDGCLQIFREMKILAESGHRCRPDSTTYRILILAFIRRLQGPGEAIKLSQEMMDSSSSIDDITPELLMEAIRACHAKTELTIATALMETALRKNHNRINVESCILFTEMMKSENLGQEALDYYSRIQQANVLSRHDEDKYLISLCRWPKRNRRGDIIDLSSFWKKVRVILENKTMSTKKPDLRVWITYMSGLYYSAKNDSSLWNIVAGATRTILDSYPTNFLGGKLVAIGLDASSFMEDSMLASIILKRVADESSMHDPSFNSVVDDSQTMIKKSAMVPFRAVKNALKICLRTSDIGSASSIQASLDQLKESYPVGAQSELYALVLLCHAKVGDAENTKILLRLMIDQDMKPGEELYSAVLHTLAVKNRFVEMEELFQSMLKNEEKEIKAGVSSYDAILLARIRARSWDGAIALYDQMKVDGIVPSSRTIQGLLVAHDQKGGRTSVLSALDSLLLCNAQFDESTFRYASKTLFKEVDNNLEDFRQTIRDDGERNLNLRVASLNLVRSIRVAEIESNRQQTMHKSQDEIDKKQDEAWKLATSYLLEFLKASAEHEDDQNTKMT